MILRWLVNTYLRQAAQEHIMRAVSETARSAAQREEAGEEGQPPPRYEIAVVFGSGLESGGLVDLLQDSVTIRSPAFVEHAGTLDERRIAVVESGVGRKAAARATADVIALHQPDWVISAGFAGALVDELKRGHFLLADSVADPQGESLAIELPFAPPSGDTQTIWHVGRLLSVDRVVRQESRRRQLSDEHGALACDMESLGVAEVCSREKTRFLAVRVITDAVDATLPKDAQQVLSQKSLAGKLGALTGAILSRPASVKDLWQLREDAMAASDRLARFLSGVIGQLPPSAAGAAR